MVKESILSDIFPIVWESTENITEEKMKNTARVLCVLLALCFLFVACDNAPATEGGNENTKQPASGEGTVATTVAPTEEGNFVPMDGLDFGGEDFVILVPKASGWSQYNDFAATELTEDHVNDANYERINAMKELYNVNIVNAITADKVVTDVQNTYKAGDNAYDAFHVEITNAASLAQAGYLVDMNQVSTMDLSNPWYNQNAVEQLSIANKLFYILGDISTVDNDGIASMCFNKELLEEQNLQSPYELIENNEWTLDNFHTLVAGMREDLNGDGEYNVEDRFGFLTDVSSYILHFGSAGVHIVEKDDNDYPILSLNTAKNVEILEDLFALYTDETTFWGSMMKLPAGHTSTWAYGGVMFMEGKLLFRQTSMYRIIETRQSEIDFGITPYPKYDAEQENYAHSFSFATPVICFLGTTEDYEATGAVIEALSYYGRTILRPAYYERVLKGLVARDEESEFCLDLIFDTADYDLGIVLGLGGLSTEMNNMVKSTNFTFSSIYDGKVGLMEQQITDYIEGFESVL